MTERRSLTREDKEILCITQEECAEVTQAISKIIRFGIDETYNGRTNAARLEDEVGDLYTMLDILVEKKLLDVKRIEEAKKAKREKLRTWSRISV